MGVCVVEALTVQLSIWWRWGAAGGMMDALQWSALLDTGPLPTPYYLPANTCQVANIHSWRRGATSKHQNSPNMCMIFKGLLDGPSKLTLNHSLVLPSRSLVSFIARWRIRVKVFCVSFDWVAALKTLGNTEKTSPEFCRIVIRVAVAVTRRPAGPATAPSSHSGRSFNS